MQNSTSIDVLLACCLIVWHLPAAEDQPLLLWRNTRLFLDFLLDPSDLVSWVDIQLDFFASEGLDFDQHNVGRFRVVGR